MNFPRLPGSFCGAILSLLGVLSGNVQGAVGIRLEIDAREASRNLVHSKLTIPATAGTTSLVFPKWIQGEHAPTGPITDTAGLIIRANGSVLSWHRDPVDMYTMHVKVPEGVQEIRVQQDFLLPAGTSGFTSAAASTDHLYLLSWNQLLLYPQGPEAAGIQFTPSVVFPDSWQVASALHTTRKEKGTMEFAPVNLTTLIDSFPGSGRDPGLRAIPRLEDLL